LNNTFYFFGGTYVVGYTKVFGVAKGSPIVTSYNKCKSLFYIWNGKGHLYEYTNGVAVLRNRSPNASFRGIGYPRTISLDKEMVAKLEEVLT
jgi:hypothetical protein